LDIIDRVHPAASKPGDPTDVRSELATDDGA
jgi:hypothetical protein